MSRRLDIELTSNRNDGTWTWRAAGAKSPKGVVREEILGGDLRVGRVFKVEAEVDIDGIKFFRSSLVAKRIRNSTLSRFWVAGVSSNQSRRNSRVARRVRAKTRVQSVA